MKYGEFVRELRSRKRITLREFCRENGIDASNWSKIERGDLPAPQYRAELERYAIALGLKEGEDEWYRFFDLASLDRGKLPEDILNNEELVDALPVFFKTFRGQKHENEDLDKIIEFIRKRK
jgi:transcriptional regulator with XRE-family HTH domain